jgi:ATP-dependent RNA helicase DBP3
MEHLSFAPPTGGEPRESGGLDSTMTTTEASSEKKIKKSKKEAKHISNAISKLNLATAEDIQTVAGDRSAKQDLSKKEKKRKRRELETEDEGDTERTPKKKKKSHHDLPPVANGGLDDEMDIKKEHKKKKKTLGGDDPANEAQIQDFLSKNSITIHGEVTPILSFSQLDIPNELRQSLQAFKEPTPIQACSWPPLLAGRDVVGIAETGRYVSSGYSIRVMEIFFQWQDLGLWYPCIVKPR